MKRYFINPELKKSTAMFMVLIIGFLAILIFYTNNYTNDLKTAYIKSIGSLAATVVEKEPALKNEIIPMITKELSDEESNKGMLFLKDYGLTEDLEHELFPYIKEVAAKNAITMTFIFGMMTFLVLGINYLQHATFYEKIRRITYGAKKVVEGEFDISISEDREGDFSKLATSFNSMRIIIRNNIEELKKEKEFLVDLLSDISHQLKTPLSSMIVYNDIMLNKDLTSEQRNTFLVNNKTQLHRMEWLIKSMLKLAKLDAKAVIFHKENESLKESVEEAVEALQSMAEEKDVNITISCNKDIVFEHDRLWLQEALINIIKNGIEHTTSAGEVQIDIVENPLYRRVIIKDCGEGIREEDLPNIFKRFYKAKSSTKSTSVGIGLALAKSIIEAHNGMIEVQSTIGKGTKFIVTFLKY